MMLLEHDMDIKGSIMMNEVMDIKFSMVEYAVVQLENLMQDDDR